MSEPPKIPFVTFRVYKGAQLSMHIGHLIRTPDGRYWAFPEDADSKQDPHLAGAYPLDPSQLEQQPDTPDGDPAFLSREVFHVPR